jgi:nitronate monooxygenase
VVIKSPVGLPGRVIRNDFTEAVNQGKKKPFKCPFHCIKTCDSTKSPYCIAMALGNARKGKLKHGFAFAGKNAYRVEKVVTVKELMTTLMEEFSRAEAESDMKGEGVYRRCKTDLGPGIRVPQKCEDSAWLF